MAFIWGVFGILLALFQIGTLCSIGQWLTTKSADLLDASFDCQWFNQSTSFKKSLIILRFVCQRETKIRAANLNFSHESLYQVVDLI